MKFIKKLAVFSVFLALSGCDDSNQNQNVGSEPIDNNSQMQSASSSIAPTEQQSTNKPNFSPTSELIQKYNGKQLKVIDASEAIIDGSSTLVVTFSVPINPQLNFSNLLRLVDTEKGTVDGAWELSNDGLQLRLRYLEPNRRLLLTIDKLLSGINDSHLQSVYQTYLTTSSREPIIKFTSSGILLPSKSMSGIPVTTLNVNKVDINFFKVKPEKFVSFFSNMRGLSTSVDAYDFNYMKQYFDLVYSSRFELNPKPNVQENMLINISNIPELKEEGVYLAIMTKTGDLVRAAPSSVFSISNIGISVHKYSNKNLLVMTHALDDGAPLGNVKITLHSIDDSKGPITVRTDAEGYAEIAMPDSSYYYLTASDDQQISFVDVRFNGLNLTDFNLSGDRYRDKQLFVFGPRDLYRPGETIFYNALLRNADGQILPDQPIVVEIKTPEGRSIGNGSIPSQSDNHGLYQFKYTIPLDAATGKWSLQFNVGDDKENITYFNVEEFLPERMALDINSSSSKPILANEDVKFDIKGRYLYGAPTSGNTIEVRAYMKKIDKLAGLNDFIIGQYIEDRDFDELFDEEKKLDSNGETVIKTSSEDFKEPTLIGVSVSLLDPGGRPVTRNATQQVWPTENMPAIRPMFSKSEYYNYRSDSYNERYTIDKDKTAEFDIAYINTDGEKLATNNLTTRIIRERRNYYWSWENYGGWRQEYKTNQFVVQEEQLSIASDNVARVSFQPNEYGSYLIEVVDNKTGAKSSLRFWSGYDWQDNTDGTNALRPDQVKLSIDKKGYKPGDIAKVHVQAPVAGSGYISLETNDGTIWKKDITVDEQGLEVEIPVENWERHDVYINAMIVRPTTDSKVQTVKRAIGLLYLPIDTSERQLTFTMDLPAKTEPEQTIPVKIKLDKQFIKEDSNITVLVSAVDSGVLNITNFATPDPYAYFLGRKRFDVDYYDVYGRLIEGSGRNVNLSFGGDAVFENSKKKPLNDVKIIAQQLDTVQLDENGEGIIDLPLPKFNGELRIMAQAWDDDRFGKAEQTMTIAAPIVVELTKPRFMAGGDKALLALKLHNMTDEKQTLQVNISSDGLIFPDLSQTTEVTLDSLQKDIIYIPVTADYGLGHFSVNTNIKQIGDENHKYETNDQWTIGVRPGYSPTNINYVFALDSGEKWKMDTNVLNDLISNSVDAKLVVSTTPPLNIAQYIKELYAYPYGCLEQTVSGLYPSLFANNSALAAMGIATESNETRRSKIQRGISRILGMQRDNGGFGLWSSESEEEFWLTVYATDFLLEAKERGYDVPWYPLDKAVSQLKKYVYDNSSIDDRDNYYRSRKVIHYNQLAIKAYALMVLAKQNQLDSSVRNEINSLYQQVKRNDENFVISPLPVLQLAVAAKKAGFETIYEDMLQTAMKTSYQDTDEWVGDYGSEIRDNALVLALLVSNQISSNNISDYLVTLSDLLMDNRYLSTQELGALFIAGLSVEENSGKDSFTFKINSETENAGSTLNKSYDYDDLIDGLTLTNTENDKLLYVKLTVSGYNKIPPVPTETGNEIKIERSYYDLKGNKIDPSELKINSLMAVVLEVSSKKDIPDAMIIDYLPAGLELENQNLTNSSINLSSLPQLANLLDGEDSSNVKYQEFRDDRYVAAVDVDGYTSNGQYTYHKRVAYLVRAVTPGNFVVPNPYVESMYRPSIFAIGQSPEIITITSDQTEQPEVE